METYNRLEKITSSDKIFFTTKDLASIFDIDSSRTLENIIVNLLDSKILTQLEKGKYFITNKKPGEFEIAQFVYSPSYISLESALNLYGILSQFPFEITSISLKKTTTKELIGKTFTYSQIKKSLFTGYIKKDNYLIALPEKALFDYLYLISKAVKTDTYLGEMDFSNIKKGKILEYLDPDTNQNSVKILDYINNYL
jgi:predicted transcriptional regulator of viral defense system